MTTKKCNLYGVIKPPPKQLPLPLPPLPFISKKPHCRGCKENVVAAKGSMPSVKLPRSPLPSTKRREPPVKKVSSSNSGLSFLPTGSNPKIDNRYISFNEGKGTSFGAHLLEKTLPLYAHKLDEKLRFKRNTDAGLIVANKPLGPSASQPKFIHQLDSEDVLMAQKRLECGQLPIGKTPLFQNEFLRTGNRGKQGLRYVVNANYPRYAKEGGEPPERKEIEDLCGRLTHHSKLRAREFGIRLCNAPSMTQELDDLYNEYLLRCGEGNEKSEACRFLQHAPSPYRREPGHSILRDCQGHDRKSMQKRQLVHFDEDVDFETNFHKMKGIVEPIRDIDGRLKLFTEPRGPLGSGRSFKQSHVPEKYPLHIDRSGNNEQNPLLSWMQKTELESLEDSKAKQDLAQIYFTTEATRIMACSTLPTLDKNTNIFKKRTETGSLVPRFFMDRLANEKESKEKKKQQEKLTAIKNEMDAFDQQVQEQPEPSVDHPEFDPLQVPSEKSMKEIKLKLEILKQQKARDTKAATERHRTRRSFFRQMLPNFGHSVRDTLLEHSIKCANHLSGEEVLLATDFMRAAGIMKKDDDKRGSFILEDAVELEGESQSGEQEETQVRRSKNEGMVRDILNVMVDVVWKMQNYKEVVGEDAPQSLKWEWADAGYSALAKRDKIEGRTDDFVEHVCPNDDDENLSSSYGYSTDSDWTSYTSNTGTQSNAEPRKKCLVALTEVDKPSDELQPGEPTKKVVVEVTDCYNEDLDKALTFDGVFLPVTESLLSKSSSEIKIDSSHSGSRSLTASPADSQTDCVIKPPIESRPNAGVNHYGDEYEGEDDFFEAEGSQEMNSAGFEKSLGREGDGKRPLGEVEVQLIDNVDLESSTKGKKVASVGVSDEEEAGGSDVSQSSGRPLQFDLPNDFESKPSSIQRKKTAFVRKPVDDDDDDDDDKSSTTRDLLGYQSGLQIEENEDEEEEEGGSAEEPGDEEEELMEEAKSDTGAERLSVLWAPNTNPPCEGYSKRRSLVYDGLKKITYGSYCKEHENKFLAHRFQELKVFTLAWSKGILKPTKVLTAKERNFLAYGDHLNGRRLPRFNILDPHIARPNFSLRMKRLMKMAEEQKIEKECLGLTGSHDGSVIPSEAPIVQKTCKDLRKKKSAWLNDIAEYECRRKEREKKELEATAADDCAKRLGFDSLYDDSLYKIYPNLDEEEGEGAEEEGCIEAASDESKECSLGSECTESQYEMNKCDPCGTRKSHLSEHPTRFSGMRKASEFGGESYEMYEYYNAENYEQQDLLLDETEDYDE